jgi:hypothetical protein
MYSRLEAYLAGDQGAISEQEESSLWEAYRELFLPARHLPCGAVDQLSEVGRAQVLDQILDVPKHL